MDDLDSFLMELFVMVEENQHALVPAYAVIDRLTEIMLARPDGVPFDGDEFAKMMNQFKKKYEQ